MIQWTRYDARPFSIQFDVDGMTYEAAASTRRAILAFFAGKRPISLECTRFDGLVLTLTDIHLAAPSAHVMHQIPFLQETLQFIAGNPFFTRDTHTSESVFVGGCITWSGQTWMDWSGSRTASSLVRGKRDHGKQQRRRRRGRAHTVYGARDNAVHQKCDNRRFDKSKSEPWRNGFARIRFRNGARGHYR